MIRDNLLSLCIFERRRSSKGSYPVDHTASTRTNETSTHNIHGARTDIPVELHSITESNGPTRKRHGWPGLTRPNMAYLRGPSLTFTTTKRTNTAAKRIKYEITQTDTKLYTMVLIFRNSEMGSRSCNIVLCFAH
ncbi:hypothetical protein DPMN_168338 [Dreissena polymorpha]|uniref:Uncharacterized protein n=1 Tax=Dreissena polymorpha TaxID=45954 RepID=A0A9D4IZK1_DREPO|nr:hypothetical protein DPMN_168338 [Dreissena polymorpha]